jgi:hypothetical protein
MIGGNVGDPGHGQIAPTAVDARQGLLLDGAQHRQVSPRPPESRMVDGKDEEETKEETAQRPASGCSPPQAPGSGDHRGKERGEPRVGDKIPAGVDLLVPGAGRDEPGFIGKARFRPHGAHERSLEARRISGRILPAICGGLRYGTDQTRRRLVLRGHSQFSR